MIFGVYDDTVVLLAAGISLELVNGKHLGELGRLERDILEIPHCGRAGNVKLRADLCGGYRFTERVDDLGNQTAGGTVVPWKEGVLLKEALAAVAAVTPLAQMQQRCSAKRNIFVIDDTFMIKDFVSMLNLFVWLRGQSMRLTPTFIVEPF